MTTAVHVVADLHLEVDGVHAHLTGTGRRVRLDLDHPVAFYTRWRRSAPGPSGLRVLAGAVRRLRRLGLGLDVGVHGRTVVRIPAPRPRRPPRRP